MSSSVSKIVNQFFTNLLETSQTQNKKHKITESLVCILKEESNKHDYHDYFEAKYL